MPLIFLLQRWSWPYVLHLLQSSQEDPVAQTLHLSGHWMPGPPSLSSPKSETATATLPRKLILNGRHLLPPIVLFQNHFSYKQGGLARPRSQVHSAATRDRASAFGACTWGRQDSYCREFLKNRKDLQKIVSGHKNLDMNCKQIESL